MKRIIIFNIVVGILDLWAALWPRWDGWYSAMVLVIAIWMFLSAYLEWTKK